MKARSQGGFSLMELVIVVMIIGILAAIAYPRYQDYVLRGNRSEAMALLNEAAAREERYFAQNNTYTDDVDKLNLGGYVGQLRFYRLEISDVTGSTYTLTAVNEKAPQTNDTKCESFVLNQAGAKSETGTSTADDCWK